MKMETWSFVKANRINETIGSVDRLLILSLLPLPMVATMFDNW